jgi:hypothetical protein
MRKCKCGEELTPRKKWFKNVIVYKCPKSNIFSRNHSISKDFFVKSKPLNIGVTFWDYIKLNK